MSLQFDPRLLLEENEQKLEDTQNKLASVSAIVARGINQFCGGGPCTITTERNRFISLVREESSLKGTINEITNNIRLLTREIELRSTAFISPAPAIIQPEAIDIEPQIIIQKVPAIDLKTAALIGGAIILLS